MFAVIVMLFLASSSFLRAQTFQYIWHLDIPDSDPYIDVCFGHPVAGTGLFVPDAWPENGAEGSMVAGTFKWRSC